MISLTAHLNPSFFFGQRDTRHVWDENLVEDESRCGMAWIVIKAEYASTACICIDAHDTLRIKSCES